MITERTNIKPKIITTQQEYNPFANKEINESLHRKQHTKLIEGLLDKTHERNDYIKFIEEAQKQNTILLMKSLPTGWCASALLKAGEIIKQASDYDDFAKIKTQAKEAFENEVSAIEWDNLVKFSQTIFKYRRNAIDPTMDIISKITKYNNDFTNIYQALTETN